MRSLTGVLRCSDRLCRILSRGKSECHRILEAQGGVKEEQYHGAVSLSQDPCKGGEGRELTDPRPSQSALGCSRSSGSPRWSRSWSREAFHRSARVDEVSHEVQSPWIAVFGLALKNCRCAVPGMDRLGSELKLDLTAHWMADKP